MTKNRNFIYVRGEWRRVISRRLRAILVAVTISIVQIFYAMAIVRADPPAALIQQGEIAFDRGNFPTAVAIWERAETGYRQARDPVGVMGSQLNRVQALVAMGRHRRACKILADTVVRVDENICQDVVPTRWDLRQPNLPPALQAAALNALGDVLRLLGNLDAARATLAQAEAIAKPLTTEDRSAIWVSMGNTWRDLGNRDRDRTERLTPPVSSLATCSTQPLEHSNAAADYQQAIACYRQAGSITARLDLLSLQVGISHWLARQNLDAIASNWQQQFNQTALIASIQTQLATQPDNYEGLNQRINFARSLVLARSPQWQPAQELLATVITRSRLLEQKSLLASATGTLGWLYEQNQQWDKALEFTQQAVVAATSSDDTLYQWEWQLGRILQHQPQPDVRKSTAAYDRAITALERTRSQIRVINPDAQFSLRDSIEPLYRELIDLSLRERQPDFPRIIDRVDALKLAELENFLQCQLDRSKPVDEFDRDPGTVVFYPIVLADRLEVILRLAGHQYRRFSVPVTRARLEQTIASFRTSLTQPQYGWNDTAAAQLYDRLIRPARSYLTPQTKNLVFVMDGAFQNIPVAALVDRSRQEFLIDRYAVAVTPGLQILGAKQRSASNRAGILIGGLTDKSASGANGKRGNIYEPLAYAADEVRAIKSLFPSSTELVGTNFTQANLQRVLANGTYPTVHLATHGRFSSDPHQTFIVTAAGSIDVNRLRSILKQDRGGSIDLMVLSACETATGDRHAALGLAGMAIRSGADSTLASLWAVDDRATAKLMQKFYGTLTQRNGATKARSLQVAQTAIRQEYPHPYYWAPFVLVGNWL
jgi:CHAT domain-containing protein